MALQLAAEEQEGASACHLVPATVWPTTLCTYRVVGNASGAPWWSAALAARRQANGSDPHVPPHADELMALRTPRAPLPRMYQTSLLATICKAEPSGHAIVQSHMRRRRRQVAEEFAPGQARCCGWVGRGRRA
eukprot:7216733-Prymnesium_polylepis.1